VDLLTGSSTTLYGHWVPPNFVPDNLDMRILAYFVIGAWSISHLQTSDVVPIKYSMGQTKHRSSWPGTALVGATEESADPQQFSRARADRYIKWWSLRVNELHRDNMYEVLFDI